MGVVTLLDRSGFIAIQIYIHKSHRLHNMNQEKNALKCFLYIDYKMQSIKINKLIKNPFDMKPRHSNLFYNKLKIHGQKILQI